MPAAPGQKASSVLRSWLASAMRVSTKSSRARTSARKRADRVGLRRQRAPAMAVGAQQVGQQVGVAGIALGAVAAVARAAGLDGVGMDREDLMACLDQGIDDQARGPLDGDAHALRRSAPAGASARPSRRGHA